MVLPHHIMFMQLLLKCKSQQRLEYPVVIFIYLVIVTGREFFDRSFLNHMPEGTAPSIKIMERYQTATARFEIRRNRLLIFAAKLFDTLPLISDPSAFFSCQYFRPDLCDEQFRRKIQFNEIRTQHFRGVFRRVEILISETYILAPHIGQKQLKSGL